MRNKDKNSEFDIHIKPVIKNTEKYHLCKKPKKIYEYNKNGKFIKEYSSLNEANENSDLFPKNKKSTNWSLDNNWKGLKFKKTPLDTYLFYNRIGRVGVLSLIKKINSKYNLGDKRLNKIKPVVMYNLDGEIIAIFRNSGIGDKIMKNMTERSVSQKINNKCSSKNGDNYKYLKDIDIFKNSSLYIIKKIFKTLIQG